MTATTEFADVVNMLRHFEQRAAGARGREHPNIPDRDSPVPLFKLVDQHGQLLSQYARLILREWLSGNHDVIQLLTATEDAPEPLTQRRWRVEREVREQTAVKEWAPPAHDAPKFAADIIEYLSRKENDNAIG